MISKRDYLSTMLEVLDRFFKNDWVRHVLFWTGLYSCFVVFGMADRSSTFLVFVEEAAYLSIYAVIVYFNFYVLIPLFLSKKRVLLFIGSLALFLALLAPVFAFLIKLLYQAFQEVNLMRSVDVKKIFLAFSLVAILSTIFQILSEWFRHERDRRELEAQKTQSELRFLKSQINPHFLFNTLNNLYALTLKKSDSAPEIVLKLSDMMRYMLYECNEKVVPLSKEIRYIENYLDLEKIRQGGDVDIRFDIEGNIDDHDVAPLLFIPFIENSFKHGVNRQLSNAFVHLKMQVTDQDITMNLVNSKPDPVPNSMAQKAGGIGLVNVKHQLNLLYPRRHTLSIEDSPVSYHIHLKINL